MRIMSIVFTDMRHLSGLVAELQAAGYTTDVCPDELKPEFDDACEYVEVTLDTDVPHQDRERINALGGVMLGEMDDICERHEAFCDSCEEIPEDHDPHIYDSPTWRARARARKNAPSDRHKCLSAADVSRSTGIVLPRIAPEERHRLKLKPKTLRSWFGQ